MTIELQKETTFNGETNYFAAVRVSPDQLATYICLGVNITDEQAIELFSLACKNLQEPKKEVLKRIEY